MAQRKSYAEKQGIEALSSHLPDVAALRFQNALEQKNNTSIDIDRLRLLLAESLIRADQAEKALLILSEPSLASLPVAIFWRAQALASLGKFKDAIALFDQAIEIKNFPFYAEAILTRSRLLSLIGNHRDAIAGLNLLTQSKSPYTTRAQLDQTELLLLTGKFADARKALPLSKNLKGQEQFEAKLLDAQLLLAEEQHSKAIDAFTSLIKSFQNADEQLPQVLHPAAIGIAKARASLNQKTEATDAILSFIQNYPESNYLIQAFSLLQFLLSEQPDPQDPVHSRILERLEQWSPENSQKQNIMVPESADTIASIAPIVATFDHPQLHVQSLYLRAISLQSSKAADQLLQQRMLITRLRIEHPNNPLAQTGQLLYARSLFQQNQNDKATNLLENILAYENRGTTHQQALLLLAAEFYRNNDFIKSAQYFTKAAEELAPTPRSSALYNAGLSNLQSGNIKEFDLIISTGTAKLKASLQLEKALYIASETPTAALALLDQFLLENPNHPRIVEAHLALAKCALLQQPANLSLAIAQLDSLDATNPFAEKTLLTRIQYTLAAKDLQQTISLTKKFLEDFPDSPQVPATTLTLGSALYQNGDLSESYAVLKKLAGTHPGQASPALLIAARAAARTGTPQSLADAMTLFDQIIQSDSGLSAYATLEKNRTLIDTKTPVNLQRAVKDLTDLFAKIEPDSELYSSAGIMLMEALYATGGSDPTQYSAALLVQEKLLSQESISPINKNRISYFRGLTLEQLKRPNEALDVYYQVIENASKEAPTEWNYIERCGFNAIALLEKNARWESAIELAKKVAKFPTPRANEAAERAKNLGLEHMIWED
jgi:outer membrane protein assembly factor BamD (BamD/ComL family)